MARKPRIDFPGAFFHVIVRGNQRATVFHDAADYAAYLDRLERYRHRDHATLHAYILMKNHVHLLVETGAQSLSRTMHALQFTYSQYYHRRYGTTGHVFQGRYHAILCDREAYLLELVRYLHLNPARLRTPLNPWTYRWSSHGAYLGQPGTVTVQTATVLDSFHRQIGPARRAYRRFLLEGLSQGHQDRFYETVDQRFLGDDRFIEEADRRTAATREVVFSPKRVPFGALLAAVATAYGLTLRALVAAGRHRAVVPARALLVHLARGWCRLTTKELGRRLHRDPSMISRLAASYATAPDRKIESRIHALLQATQRPSLDRHAWDC